MKSCKYKMVLSEWKELKRTKRGLIGTHSSFGSHSCNDSLVSSGNEVF